MCLMDLLYILNSVSKQSPQHTENVRAPSARVLKVKGHVLDVFSDVEQISSYASREVEVAGRRRCTRLTTSSFLPKSSISIKRISEFPKCWISSWAPFQFKAKIAKTGDTDGNRNVLKSAGMSKSMGARGNLWNSECTPHGPIANSSVVKNGPTEGKEDHLSGKTAGLLELKDICG
eukprot:CAMPEP_0172177376 /NCGR_PEP_ID=MMETSP1050-20130122/15400_1 /TAXON_ID=233186 /ORGANISM="Cryptomonas curvata, Strain CCAP979/52" /LENGTH=175 /DNA_ID=CAMNT_0012849885 /DNA_START=124 /DNA_END=651 /DNA_ORIENTATION=+